LSIPINITAQLINDTIPIIVELITGLFYAPAVIA